MRDTPGAVMIFAAGFGRRMGTLTKERPKPLIEVAGKPLIDYAIEQAQSAHIVPIVANAHYMADRLVPYLETRGIVASVEAPDILDTGGGLRQALPLLGSSPVVTLNSDAIWTGPHPVRRLIEAWRPDDMDALLLLLPWHRARAHAGRGSFSLSGDGRIRRGGGMTYTGAQILRTDRLGEICDRAFSLNAYWDLLGRDERLYGVVHKGQWCDVGHPKGIAEAEAMLREDGNV